MRTIGSWLKHIVLAIIGLAVLAAPYLIRPAHSAEAPFSVAATLTGIAKVRDGDGVLFGEFEVRLQGIAAPEDNSIKRDPDGPASSANLRAYVEGKALTCKLDGTVASSNRPVGICYLDGADIGEYQVRTGFARDCSGFSHGRYTKAEADAKAEGHDLSKTYSLPAYCKRN